LLKRVRDPSDRAAKTEDAERRPYRKLQMLLQGYERKIDGWPQASELFHSLSQSPPTLSPTTQLAENS
jgi:hypothetical protein